MVLSECHCSSHTSKQSVFNRLSAAPVSNLAKRRCSRRKRTFSDTDTEYPDVTSNMVGPSTSPSKSKGNQSIVSSDESDDEPSGLRELLTEPEKVYQHTHTRIGIIAPVNFSALARGIKVREAHSTIAEFICIELLRRERSLCVYDRPRVSSVGPKAFHSSFDDD